MKRATQGRRWQRIISSPLRRCADFAQALARRQAIPLGLDKRLMEMDFGAWEGHTPAAVMAQDPDALARFWAAPHESPPPDGERLVDFEARVLAAWRDVVDGADHQRLLLITHGGVMRVLLCHLQGLPAAALLEIEVKHAALFAVRAAGKAGAPPTPVLVE